MYILSHSLFINNKIYIILKIKSIFIILNIIIYIKKLNSFFINTKTKLKKMNLYEVKRKKIHIQCSFKSTSYYIIGHLFE